MWPNVTRRIFIDICSYICVRTSYTVLKTEKDWIFWLRLRWIACSNPLRCQKNGRYFSNWTNDRFRFVLHQSVAIISCFINSSNHEIIRALNLRKFSFIFLFVAYAFYLFPCLLLPLFIFILKILKLMEMCSYKWMLLCVLYICIYIFFASLIQSFYFFFLSFTLNISDIETCQIPLSLHYHSALFDFVCFEQKTVNFFFLLIFTSLDLIQSKHFAKLIDRSTMTL